MLRSTTFFSSFIWIYLMKFPQFETTWDWWWKSNGNATEWRPFIIRLGLVLCTGTLTLHRNDWKKTHQNMIIPCINAYTQCDLFPTNISFALIRPIFLIKQMCLLTDFAELAKYCRQLQSIAYRNVNDSTMIKLLNRWRLLWKWWDFLSCLVLLASSGDCLLT